PRAPTGSRRSRATSRRSATRTTGWWAGRGGFASTPRGGATTPRRSAASLRGPAAGPGAKPTTPAGSGPASTFPPPGGATRRGEGLYRRGLYTHWQRSFPHPSLLAFDALSREECCVERPRSNIPQQALVLLNDPTYVEAARVFAERILKEGGASVGDRLAWAF